MPILLDSSSNQDFTVVWASFFVSDHYWLPTKCQTLSTKPFGVVRIVWVSNGIKKIQKEIRSYPQPILNSTTNYQTYYSSYIRRPIEMMRTQVVYITSFLPHKQRSEVETLKKRVQSDDAGFDQCQSYCSRQERENRSFPTSSSRR